MKSLITFFGIGVFTLTSLGQPIYFENDIVIDTSTVDLVAQDFPDFDIDANDNICFVWTEELIRDHTGLRSYITAILSSDGGETFYGKNFVEENPEPDPYFGSSIGQSRISYDISGDPVVAWREVSSYLIDGWVNFAKSSDGGLSYPPHHHSIHDRDATYDMVFADDNTFYVAWYDNNDNRIHLGISNDGGITFDTVTTVVDLTAMGWSTDSGQLTLTVDNQRVISVFWTSFSPLRKLWLSRSEDGGTNFAPADTFLNFPYKQIGNKVIVLNAEYYMLFWGFIDQNNNHIYFSKSSNNGQDFTDPLLIGEVAGRDIHYSNKNGLLLLSANKVYRSRDLGETFPDTAYIRADSGHVSSAQRILSDSHGNVYTLGQRVNLNNIDMRHIVLNKTSQLVAIDQPANGRNNFSFILKQNYPNPFNPATVIGYSVSVNRSVTLKIYDILGRPVRTLVEARQPPGNYTVTWDGRNEAGNLLGSGIYIYRLTAGAFSGARKMLLVR